MAVSILANHARQFNSYLMPHINEAWVSRVLNMPPGKNPRDGPDLEDEEKIVEVKFKLVHPEKFTHKSWRVLEGQMDYGIKKKAYWALGLYRLDRPVIEINSSDEKELEKMVQERSIYLVEWSWMNQFTPYRQVGKTCSGKYDNTIRFPKFRDLPKVTRTYEVEKGLVHITKGVPAKEFRIRTADAPF